MCISLMTELLLNNISHVDNPHLNRSVFFTRSKPIEVYNPEIYLKANPKIEKLTTCINWLTNEKCNPLILLLFLNNKEPQNIEYM